MNVIHQRNRSRPLCINQDKLIIYSKSELLSIDLDTFKCEKLTSFDNFSFLRRFGSHSRLLERLMRLEPGFSLLITDDKMYVPINGALYLLDLNDGSLKLEHKFRKEMRSYLSATKVEKIEGFTDCVCYGEYFNNPRREEVRIWRRNVSDDKWEIAYTFEKGMINHIHSIVPDRYRDVVWILTGDFDQSAGFWIATDDFRKVRSVAIGKQKYRSCAAFPLPEGVLYATDTQFEANSIRLLREVGPVFETEKLYDLEGSCIYSCTVGERYFFSTAVEPASKGKSKLDLLSYKRGKGIKSWNSEIIMGNLKEGFKRITVFEKDFLPMGLFQFGTVTFPSAQAHFANLVFQGIGLRRIDGKMLIVELD